MRDARSVAIDALVRIEDGAYAHVMLPQRLRASGLDARDRAFVTHLVYGSVRMQRRLDGLLAPRCHQPFDRLEPRVRAALRVGAFQLLEGMAPHAAVNATVQAAMPRARGLVNAVLRSVAAAGPPFPEPDDLGERYSYPDWIVAELGKTLSGGDLAAALAAGNEPAATTLRPNRRVTTADALEAELSAAGVRVERGTLLPDALIVSGIGDPAALPAVAEGRATPQDQGSQAIVGVLDPRPGERILDVASAPGGKTTAAAERAVGGLVVAADVHPNRLGLVRHAARRLDLSEVACGRRRAAAPRARRQLRPRARRRPLLGPRRAATPPRGAVADPARRGRRARRAPARAAHRSGARGAPRGPGRLRGVHAHPARDERDRGLGVRPPRRLHGRAPTGRAVGAARRGSDPLASPRRHRRHVRAVAASPRLSTRVASPP